jgi:hypothetical protein
MVLGVSAGRVRARASSDGGDGDRTDGAPAPGPSRTKLSLLRIRSSSKRACSLWSQSVGRTVRCAGVGGLDGDWYSLQECVLETA